MQFFSWGKRNEDSQPRSAPPPTEPPKLTVNRDLLSLSVSYQLEGGRPGHPILVTPSGVGSGIDKNSAASGVLVCRVEPTPGNRARATWLIEAPRSDVQVSVFTDGPQLLSPGQQMTVPGLSDLTVGDLHFTLPGYGIHLSGRNSLPTSDTSALTGMEKKFPQHSKALQSFREAVDLIRQSAGGVGGAPYTQGYERARFRVNDGMRSAFRISIDGNNESTTPNPTYRDALRSLDVMKKSLVIDDDTIRIQIPNLGDPSGRGTLQDKLIVDGEREVSTFYTLLFAVQLRSTIGAALSRSTRHHPEGGKIKPETDATLFLHEIGVPLSPYFLHQSPPRRAAFDIISANPHGSRGNSQGPSPR